jgi:nucleoside-diphosphate-sugar epimerase
MKILFTGASSFTGYWFVKELHDEGHDVTVTLRGNPGSYYGIRGERVERISRSASVVWNCHFGDETFLALVRSGNFAVLCHHAARVENYRSLDFDPAQALAENTRGISMMLESGAKVGLQRVVLTGSYFEQNEGAGDLPLLAFSPYGLSKGLTSDTFRFWCAHFGVPLGKFVIPNPFGPFADPRFCEYLVQTWVEGKVATVKTPDYVRDNIHISLLAKAYVAFVGEPASESFRRIAPSGYVESQGAFSQRFARELGQRLGLKCDVSLGHQTEFPEPRVRTNIDKVDFARLGWVESRAWDELAEYYAVRSRASR